MSFDPLTSTNAELFSVILGHTDPSEALNISQVCSGWAAHMRTDETLKMLWGSVKCLYGKHRRKEYNCTIQNFTDHKVDVNPVYSKGAKKFTFLVKFDDHSLRLSSETLVTEEDLKSKSEDIALTYTGCFFNTKKIVIKEVVSNIFELFVCDQKGKVQTLYIDPSKEFKVLDELYYEMDQTLPIRMDEECVSLLFNQFIKEHPLDHYRCIYSDHGIVIEGCQEGDDDELYYCPAGKSEFIKINPPYKIKNMAAIIKINNQLVADGLKIVKEEEHGMFSSIKNSLYNKFVAPVVIAG
nr:hypothetical protein [Chlamydiota bacterium]